MFEKVATIPTPMNNEYIEYYFIKKVFLSDFQATLRDKVYHFSSDSHGWHDQTRTSNGRSTNAKMPKHLKMLLEMGQMQVLFNAETKKAKAVLLPNPMMDYDFNINMVQVDKFENSQGHREVSHEDNEHKTRGLTVGNVNKKNISSPTSFVYSTDYLVTSGDGVNFMAGSGKYTGDDCSHSTKDYTTCKVERSFTWKFNKKLKKE